MNLEDYLNKKAALVDRNLKKILPKGKSRLEQAMRYTIFVFPANLRTCFSSLSDTLTCCTMSTSGLPGQ